MTTDNDRMNTVEIIYTWPDGREDIRYRRLKDSAESLEMIGEILDLQKQHGKSCPYTFQYTNDTIT